MIRVNDTYIDVRRFPDNTQHLIFGTDKIAEPYVDITWIYENDMELFTLICITKHIQEKCGDPIRLWMPYIPNARMDRVKNNDDVFTLKYFAEIINSLNFAEVRVLDPHSPVSEALIDRIVVNDPSKYINSVIYRIKEETSSPVIFFPDEGAKKRYSDNIKCPFAFGIKNRDWQTGKILGLDVIDPNHRIKGNNVLIIDDICSKGGTFCHAAEELKKLGAKDIYLFVTHCEPTILKGEIFKSGLIKRVYTTNSLWPTYRSNIENIDKITTGKLCIL